MNVFGVVDISVKNDKSAFLNIRFPKPRLEAPLNLAIALKCYYYINHWGIEFDGKSGSELL